MAEDDSEADDGCGLSSAFGILLGLAAGALLWSVIALEFVV